MFSQIAAVAIFVVMFAMIVWDKVERQIVTLFSGLATIVFVFIFGMHSKEAIFNTLNIKAIFTTDFWYHVGQGGEESSGINWAIKHASKEDVERITEEIREDEEMDNGPADIMSVTNIKYFYISSAIFGLAIVLLITHATTGLTVAFIGTLIAILTLLAAGRNALELLKRVDYKTLLFFVGLFVVVGGLEETGVLVMIADFIGNISGGNILLLLFFLFPLELLLTVLLLSLPLCHLNYVNINTIITIKIAKPILIPTSLPAGFSRTSSLSIPCFLPPMRILRSLGIK